MTAWDISTVEYVQGKGIGATSPLLRGGFINPDGSKIYISDNTANEVNEYALSTPYDVSTMSYTDKFTALGAQGMTIADSGNRLYTCESGAVHQYDIGTSWDISTSSFVRTLDVSAKEAKCMGLFFKPDGSKMFIAGYTGQVVDEWALSTPWDISSATWTREFDVSGQETAIMGLFFKPDGSKMFITGWLSDAVIEYALSTPWNVSSAGFTDSYDASGEDTDILDLFFSADGSKMYILGLANSTVHEYNLPVVVGTNMKVNITDVFKDISELKINIGDAWKNVVKVQQNIGDVWKDVFG